MKDEIALFGGSFNPPGMHHFQIAIELREKFRNLVILPCGQRPDKKNFSAILSAHRAIMVYLTFRNLDVRIDFDDISGKTFTRTWKLQKKYEPFGNVWHCIGTDLVQNGRIGQSEIQTQWERGSEIWRDLNFIILTRPGYPFDPSDLPPKHKIIETDFSGASSDVRDAIIAGKPFGYLVVPEVAEFIKGYDLYRKKGKGYGNR